MLVRATPSSLTNWWNGAFGREGLTDLEWPKSSVAQHSPHSTLAETMDKIRILKKLGTPDWNLDAIPAARQAAYA